MARLVIALGAALAMAGAAEGAYVLTPLAAGSLSITVNPGQSFSLDFVLTSNADDVHNSAIFVVAFTAPGLVLESYTWASPYQTGSIFDASKPSASKLPVTIDNTILTGPAYPPGLIGFELANVVPIPGPGPGSTFGVGVIVTVELHVPTDWFAGKGKGGPSSVFISVLPDTFANGFDIVATDSGESFELIIVPAPGAVAVLAAGLLWPGRRRRRGARCVSRIHVHDQSSHDQERSTTMRCVTSFKIERILLFLVMGLVAVGLSQPAAASGAEKTWTGAGGNFSWHNPANWEPVGVPEVNDDVVIDLRDQTITVTYTTGTSTIKSLACAENLTISGGSLSISGGGDGGGGGTPSTISGVLTLSGGTLTGEGNFTLLNQLNWTGGTLSGSGNTVIAIGATFTINGGSVNFGRNVENFGTTNWNAGQIVSQNPGGSFINRPTGTFNANTSNTWFANGGTNSFVNEGTFNRSGAGTTAFTNNGVLIPFINAEDGQVNIVSGILRFNSGGDNHGAIDIAGGAALTVASTTYNFHSGSFTASGGAGGSLNILGTANFTEDLDLPAAITLTGTLTGPGNVFVLNHLSWPTGAITGSGSLVIAEDAVFAINGGSVNFGRNVENFGTTNWNTGQIVSVSPGGTFTNRPGGTFNANTSNTWFANGGTNSFVNEGTFNRSGAGTTAFTNNGVLIPFINAEDGQVNIVSGILRFNSGGDNHGAIDIAGGAALTVASTTYNFHSGPVTSPGGGGGSLNILGVANFVQDVDVSAAVALSGTLTGPGICTILNQLTWTSGTMSGSGTTVIAEDAVLTMSGGSLTFARNVENFGTTNWNVGQIFSQNPGGTFINRPAGVFNASVSNTWFASGGTNAFINEGTFNRSGGGTTAFTSNGVNIPVTNAEDGQINVLSGILRFNSGGDNHGSFHIAEGATLTLASTAYNVHDAQLAGDGVLQVLGTVNFTEDVDVDVHIALAGTLTGPGNVTIVNQLTWTSGALTGSGGGSLLIAEDALLLLSGGSLAYARNVENFGATDWNTGQIVSVAPGGSFINHPDATFNANTANSWFGNGGTNAFINEGTFNRSATGTTSFQSNGVNIPFTNTGEVNVLAGALTLNSGLPQFNAAENTLAGGTWNVLSSGPTATLNFPAASGGVRTLGRNTHVKLAGENSTFAAINSLTTINPTASFALDQGRDFTATPNNGVLANYGDLHLGEDSDMTVTGNYLQSADAALHITISQKSALPRLETSQGADIDGTLGLSFAGGFAPSIGGSNTILSSAAGLNGVFAEITQPILDCLYAVDYSPFDVIVTFSGCIFADLVAVDFDAPTLIPGTPVNEGSTIDVTWTVENQGEVAAENPWVDRIFIIGLPGTQHDGAEFTLGEFPRDESLAVGASYSRSESVSLPANVSGTFLLALHVDAGGAVLETNATNNILILPDEIDITPMPRPDLIVLNLTPPPANQLIPGNVVEIAWTVQNIGTADAEGPWVEQLSSATDAGGSNAIVLGTFNYTDSIAPGSTVLRIENVTVPAVPPGEFFAIACVDTENVIDEIDETNNCAAEPVCVGCVFADLVATDISGPAAALDGETIEVTWTVFNEGEIPAAGLWVDRISLLDSRGKPIAVLGNFAQQGPLDVNDSYTRTEPVTIPLGLEGGGFQVAILVDATNQVPEPGATANNFLVSKQPIQIDLAPRPDLVVAPGSIIHPSSGFTGKPVTIEWTVTNAGRAAVPDGSSWTDRVFLTLSNRPGPGDLIHFGSAVVSDAGGLEPGGTYTKQITANLPAVEGEYFVVVVTDFFNTVYEGAPGSEGEANNQAIGDAAIAVTHEPFPDLIVDVVIGPATADVGSAVSIEWTVTNDGNLAAAAGSSWIDRVFISNDPNIGGDTQLAQFTIDLGDKTLPPGESYTRVETINLPAQSSVTGPHWFVVRTNATNTLNEGAGGTNNNSTITAEPTGILAPDLVVELVAAPTTATLGETITVDYSVINSGDATANGTWQDRVFLSSTPTLSGASLLATLNINDASPLAPNDSYQRIIDVTIPLSQSQVNAGGGTRFIIIQTDATNTVIELGSAGEANNVQPSDPIDVGVPPLPNLVVIAVDDPPSGLPGAVVPVSWTLKNIGSAPASGPWIDSVLASSDATIGSDAFAGSSVFSETLNPGEEIVRTTNIQIPDFTSNIYHVVICADSAQQIIEEFPGAADNCAISLGHGSIHRADLVVTPGSVVAPTFAEGDQLVTITWTTANIGLSAANPFWIESVSIQKADADGDPLPDSSPILLGTTVFTTPLPPQQSLPRSLNVKIPGNVPDGDYVFIVVTDITDVVPEAGPDNPTNNTSYATNATQIEQPDRPNLIVDVGAFVIPPDGLVAQAMSVTYSATNIGVAAAAGAWTDRVFAVNESTGTEVILGDVFVTFAPANPLLPAASYETTIQSTYPLTAGEYRIKVHVNRTGSLNEGLKGGADDNIALSPQTFLADTYIVTVHTPIDKQVSSPTQPVPIMGMAMLASTGEPAGNAAVVVAVTVQSTQRALTTQTNEQGAFFMLFHPLPNEAGLYTLTAGPPGNIDPEAQDTFVLHGMRTQPAGAGHTVFPNVAAVNGTLTLINNGDTPLSGIEAAVNTAGLPRGVTIEVNPPGNALAPLGQMVIPYSISATGEDFGFFTDVELLFSSSQGAAAKSILAISIQPPQAHLTATPASLAASMVVPRASSESIQTLVEFQVKNIGAGAATNAQVLIPSVPWMALATPANLGTIGPGQTKSVVLILTPPPDLPLGPHTGTLVVNADNAGVTVPFNFNAVSAKTGNLLVKTVNEFSFYDAENNFPPLSGATVTIRDAFTNQIVATGVTAPPGEGGGGDAPGTVTFPELPSAYYKIQITAPGHVSFSTALLLPGTPGEQTFNVEAFLSKNVVSYEWTVIPKVIKDEYTVTITAIFETFVPIPVVTIEPAFVDLNEFIGTSQQIDFTVTNHGLITADDVHLTFGSGGSRFAITPLISEFGDLPALSSFTVPVLIEDTEGGVAASGCGSPNLGAKWSLTCGTPQAYSQSVGFNNPPSPGCGGGVSFGTSFTPGSPGFGGFGGGGPAHHSPSSFSTPGGCGCIQGCAASALGCVPGIGCGVGVGSTAISIATANGSADQARAIAQAGGTLVDCMINMTPGLSQAVCACTVARDCILCQFGGVGPFGGCGGLSIPCTPGDVVANVISAGSGTACQSGGGADGGGAGGGGSTLPPEVFFFAETVEGQALQLIPLFYFFGDNDWLIPNPPSLDTPTSGSQVAAFIDAFVDVTEESSADGALIAASETPQLAALLPAHVNASHLAAFVGRWNRTVMYQAAGVFTVEELIACLADAESCPIEPHACHSDPASCFMDAAVMATLTKWALEAEKSAADAGFASIEAAAVFAQQQFLAADFGNSAGAVCSKVTVQLSQDIAIAREAFEATLKLENSGGDAISSIFVGVIIKDELGQPANHLFEILGPVVTGMGAVDGTGSLGAGNSGTSQWLIVPTHDAAPEAPLTYYVSGTLAYGIDGVMLEIPLFPVPILVHPNANLDLKYFLEKQVYGDDPFTSDIEPSVPFVLGLMIANKGAGPANDLQITTAQPEVIENELGLVIAFQLIAAILNGEEFAPSLTLNFGDIGPNDQAVATWLLTSTLQGQFISYDATFENKNGLGAPGVSLIDTVTIHPMLHAVRADAPPLYVDDEKPDFVALDSTFGHVTDVHLSNGAVEPVTVITEKDGAVVSGPATKSSPVVDLTVPLPADAWSYIRIEDPSGGEMVLHSVMRSDGKPILMGHNAWQTRAILNPQHLQQPAFLHIFDRATGTVAGGGGDEFTYTLSFDAPIPDPAQADEWLVLATHGGGVGEVGLAVNDGTAFGGFTEPRSSGVQTLHVTFTQPINSATFTPANVSVKGLDVNNEAVDLTGVVISTGLVDGQTLGVITFTPALPNAARYCIELVGVIDATGQLLQGQTTAIVGALAGDATGDLRVNSTDVGAIMSLVGTSVIDPLNVNHVRSDLDLDGAITMADVQIALGAQGPKSDLRFTANPCETAPLVWKPGEASIDPPVDGLAPIPVTTHTQAAALSQGSHAAAASASNSNEPLEHIHDTTPIALHIAAAHTEPLVGDQFYSIDLPADETVRIALHHECEGAWTELYIKRGDSATRLDHDAASVIPGGGAEQVITLHTTEAGRYTILAAAHARPAAADCSERATILAETRSFGVTSLDQSALGRGEATLTLRGSRLHELRSVSVGGTAAMRIEAIDHTSAAATFDLRSLPAGEYDMVATSHRGPMSILPRAVLVQQPTPPSLAARFEPPAAFMLGQTGTVDFIIENPGNIDVHNARYDLRLPNSPTAAPRRQVTTASGAVVEMIDAATVRVTIERIAPGTSRIVPIEIIVGESFKGESITIETTSAGEEHANLDQLGLAGRIVVPVSRSHDAVTVTSSAGPLTTGTIAPAFGSGRASTPWRIAFAQPPDMDRHVSRVLLVAKMAGEFDPATVRFDSIDIGGVRLPLAPSRWRQEARLIDPGDDRIALLVDVRLDPYADADGVAVLMEVVAVDAQTNEPISSGLWPHLPRHAHTVLSSASLAYRLGSRNDAVAGSPMAVEPRAWIDRTKAIDGSSLIFTVAPVAEADGHGDLEPHPPVTDRLNLSLRLPSRRLEDERLAGARLVVATDEAPAVPQEWQPLGELAFTGEAGRIYDFFVQVTDAAGNHLPRAGEAMRGASAPAVTIAILGIHLIDEAGMRSLTAVTPHPRFAGAAGPAQPLLLEVIDDRGEIVHVERITTGATGRFVHQLPPHAPLLPGRYTARITAGALSADSRFTIEPARASISGLGLQ